MKVMFLAFLVAALFVCCPAVEEDEDVRSKGLRNAPARPIVGAIRWDAWHGDKGIPGKAVEKSLGPRRWHHRLPFFGSVVSDTEVKINGASQAIMDQEIAYAHQAGLDYWAFVTYEPDDPMSLGLKYYLSSSRKQDINFCLITSPNNWGVRQEQPQKMQRLVRLMTEPTYQKVLGERPLLYVGFISDDWIKAWGGWSESRRIFDDFRSAVKQVGLANPYIVVMDFNPEHGKQLADQLGCDAISAYATSADGRGAPYSELARHTEHFWERCKDTQAQAVPIVMAGWDRRPRVENPVPWETWQKPGVGIEKYYEPPTPAELASHLERALVWVANNPNAAQARAVLIYAWNENDEGGWLVPTLSEGITRIEAIGKVLTRQEKSASITVNVNKVIGEVNPWIFGSNMIGYQKGGWPHATPDYADRSSGMWDPERKCSVTEMVALAKNAGLSVARYPGG